MADDCKRERFGLKAQTRIPMRESGSGLPYVRYALACRDLTNRAPGVIRISPDNLGLGWLSHDKLKHIGHFSLEVQFQTELELARIECGGWTTVVASIARPLIESTNVVDKRRGRTFIEPVEEVEAFSDQFKP